MPRARSGLDPGIDLPARGSATLGGMVSTNAGGLLAFRNGNMRHRVLGLEVVLPDGRVMNELTRVVKTSAGYDLKHLFIGAEGTLGLGHADRPQAGAGRAVARHRVPGGARYRRDAGGRASLPGRTLGQPACGRDDVAELCKAKCCWPRTRQRAAGAGCAGLPPARAGGRQLGGGGRAFWSRGSRPCGSARGCSTVPWRRPWSSAIDYGDCARTPSRCSGPSPTSCRSTSRCRRA